MIRNSEPTRRVPWGECVLMEPERVRIRLPAFRERKERSPHDRHGILSENRISFSSPETSTEYVYAEFPGLTQEEIDRFQPYTVTCWYSDPSCGRADGKISVRFVMSMCYDYYPNCDGEYDQYNYYNKCVCVLYDPETRETEVTVERENP